MSSRPEILLIIGSGDQSDRIRRSGPTEITVRGSSDLHKLLTKQDKHELLHVSRNYFRQMHDSRDLHYRVLVNLITEPEQSVRTLNNLRKILRGLPGRVLNPPDAVLQSTRDKIARLLTGTRGLIVPRTLRLAAKKPEVAARVLRTNGMALPIILRRAGTHGGKIVGCFDSIEAAAGALEDGDEHLATEFVDFASPDGLYRKYRVFFIGHHAVLRHMIVSDHWNVHANARSDFMANRAALVAEERALFEHPGPPLSAQVRTILAQVRKTMALDFFGMDFGVTRGGQVVLFEANATMSFFPLSPDPQFSYLDRCFAPAQAAFRELLGITDGLSLAQAPRFA